MLRIALIYGSIAGLIIIGTITIGMAMSGGHGSGSSQWLGYLIMLLALSLIYFGVKQYRDKERGGVISFGQAFLTGLLIAGVASIIYVVVWEIYLASTDYAFMDQYTAALIEKKQAAGLSAEALQAEITKLEEMMANYRNPLYRVPITFTEILPVGLIVALICAAFLRNRGPAAA